MEFEFECKQLTAVGGGCAGGVSDRRRLIAAPCASASAPYTDEVARTFADVARRNFALHTKIDPALTDTSSFVEAGGALRAAAVSFDIALLRCLPRLSQSEPTRHKQTPSHCLPDVFTFCCGHVPARLLRVLCACELDFVLLCICGRLPLHQREINK